MNTINTICTVLTFVFVFGLFLLAIQIIYVLWRRRSLHVQSSSISNGAQFSGDSFFSPQQQPSKELLYFFCWKNQASRIEPAATAPPLPVAVTPSEADVEEMLKWNGMYGPPRGLFTIREEEREEIIETSQVGGNNNKNINVVVNIADVEERDETTRSDVVSDEEVDGVVADVEGLDESTPFDTPCGSPPYYTPSPSPSRNGVVSSHDNTHTLSFSIESDSTEEYSSGMPEKLTAGV